MLLIHIITEYVSIGYVKIFPVLNTGPSNVVLLVDTELGFLGPGPVF